MHSPFDGRHVRRLAVAICAAALLTPIAGIAQSQLPRPAQLPPAGGQGPSAPQRPPAAQPAQSPAPQQAQAPTPPRPYQPVAVEPPPPANDPTFDAFRKQLSDVASRKDRAALARLVVASGFFWEGETGDKINKKKSSMDNLAAAIGLNDKDGSGWDVLASAAAEPTLEPVEARKGVMCGPASPKIDETAFQNLIKATATDAEEWGYPTSAGLEVRAAPQPNAPVIEKLGLNLVRVLPDEVAGGPAPSTNQPPPMIRVVGPSGKTGFLPAEALQPVVFDQMCYVKDASGWKIAGYAGGEE
jgi:hypothetical protein